MTQLNVSHVILNELKDAIDAKQYEHIETFVANPVLTIIFVNKHNINFSVLFITISDSKCRIISGSDNIQNISLSDPQFVTKIINLVGDMAANITKELYDCTVKEIACQ